MLRYVTRRVFLMIPTLFILYTLLFVLMRVVPGDIVDLYLEGGTVRSGAELEAQKLALKQELGIDKSLPEQYGIAVKKLLTGDLGQSMTTRKPVTDEIKRRGPITLELALLASSSAVIVAIPAGVSSASRQRTALDQVVRVWSIITLSVPNFWVGTMVVLLPALWWGYGAPPVYRSPFEDLAGNLQQVLPAAIVLGLAPDVVQRLRKLDYRENNLGWGVDWVALCYTYANNGIAVRDRSVAIRHDPGSGYPPQEAARQRDAFLRQMTLTEHIQYRFLDSMIEARRRHLRRTSGTT